MAVDFFQTMFSTVDTALASHVVNGSTALISLLSPIFTSMVIIWITIWGYMAMMGRVEGLLQDSFFRIIRIVFIISLGLTAGRYNTIIVAFLQNSPEIIASTITGSPTSTLSSILDTLLSKILIIGNKAWSYGGISDMGQYFIALIIYGFGGTLLVLLGSLIMMSKVVLVLLLAIGPLFIISTLFQTTQRFFDSWVGILMNAAFVLILSSSLGGIFITIAQSIANEITIPTISVTIGFALLFSMLIFVVKQIPGIAAALGGGFTLSAQGAMRGMVDKIKETANAVDRTPRHIRSAGHAFNRGDRLTTKAANVGANATKHAYQRTFRKNTISK